MERSYFRDGTPLDILRRRAKALKKEQAIKLQAAQDSVAQECGCTNWSDLTQNCWAEPFVDPGTASDDYCLENNQGPDQVSLDFELFAQAIEDVSTFEMLEAESGHEVWAQTEVNVFHLFGGVQYDTTLGMATSGHIGQKCVASITPGSFPAIKRAIDLYAYEEPIGPLIAVFNDWDLMNLQTLTSTDWGELDAWLILLMRREGCEIEGRLLLNNNPVELEAVVPGDWDWKRAFPFKLKDGRILVCNGATNRHDMRYEILDRRCWEALEIAMRIAFPNGPEKTHASETWLRTALKMDEWDARASHFT